MKNENKIENQSPRERRTQYQVNRAGIYLKEHIPKDGYEPNREWCIISDLLRINERLQADLRGKDNEIDVLKCRVKYLSQFKPVSKGLVNMEGF